MKSNHLLTLIVLTVLAVSHLGCGRGRESSSADFERNPVVPGGAPRPAGAGLQFVSLSYEKAIEKARSEGKFVMVDFYADWCGWCKKMEKEVFSDPRMGAATAGFIPIRLNTEEEGRAPAERLGVDGLPTIVFVDGSGKVVERLVGYTGTERMLQVLETLSKKRS